MKCKNTISIILSCIIFIFVCLPVNAGDKITQTQDKFTYDHLWAIVGMQVLTEANDEETIWDEKSHIMNIVPLFDCNDEVMAYYVEISPCGYMIINADVNNPDVLEFAYDQGDYSEIYCEYKDGNRVYYNGFGTPLIKKENDYYFIGNNSDEKISEVIYKQNINILKNTIK